MDKNIALKKLQVLEKAPLIKYLSYWALPKDDPITFPQVVAPEGYKPQTVRITRFCKVRKEDQPNKGKETELSQFEVFNPD